MSTASTFKVRFVIASEDRFTALTRVYDRIRECKAKSTWPETKEEWMSYFDAKALSHFWWPTAAELKRKKTFLQDNGQFPRKVMIS